MGNEPDTSSGNKELILPELSYAIIGAAFTVFNHLGWGFSEKDYGNALAIELQKQTINFKREVYVPLRYGPENVGRYFADFIIEGKILVELKVVHKLGYTHAKQVLGYLRSGGFRLGLLIYFTNGGVKYRRILNSGV
ncbi:MAG: GxxExxY protein [bacterium]|nr:GxxExxY protein [bacterium]